LGWACPLWGEIIYVDAGAAGANDGSSWADAYNYLQDALADAHDLPKPVEVRVAEGVYRPDEGAGQIPGDRNAAFQLISGVTLRGGFAGIGRMEADARNVGAYRTILSADLNGDDIGVSDPEDLSGEPTRAENSVRVVTGSGTDRTVVLDGFTITAGSKGMDNVFGNPTVANCTFSNNATSGMDNWRSSPILTNCTFKGNSRSAIDHSGGGSLTLTGCLFSANSGVWGVGIHSRSSELTLRDCTFVGNVATSSGGVIHCLGGNLALYNCEFRANVASAVEAYSNGKFLAEDCIFTRNVGGAIRHSSGRMVVSNCVFAGNRDRAIDTHSRYTTVRNCTFSGNSATHGGSALCGWHGPRVSNCIFWGNSSPAIDIPPIKVPFEEPLISYCDVQGGWPGEGNIDIDPCFVEPGYWDVNGTPEDANDDFWVDGDYHLPSQAGRWDPHSQSWVQDDLTSPCIDAGDPNSPLGIEPFPNGGRVNMGAYGAGDRASKSYFGEPVCETVIAGDINGDCKVDCQDFAIMSSHWLMQGEDFVNRPPTVRLVEPQDGDQIEWSGPIRFRAEAHDADGEVHDIDFRIRYESADRITIYGFSGSEGTGGWEGEYTLPDDITPGDWTVWAEVTDNEGTVGVSPEIEITLHRLQQRP
jgi:hypothetical protein